MRRRTDEGGCARHDFPQDSYRADQVARPLEAVIGTFDLYDFAGDGVGH
jgi:hypothetical protein